ncbi:MAG TPA: hypothetical protein VLK28_00135 [Methylomirabilota bacterium]|nr:hypothetical protein [Methylomirabilota bacterium]
MMPSIRDDEKNCPCLTPTVGRRDGSFPVPVYCRPGRRRVRVPTREELAARCTAERYLDCPGYRRFMADRTWPEA